MRILFDPEPRSANEIFSDSDRALFFKNHDVIEVTESNRSRAYEEHLPVAEILISQQPMSTASLSKAKNLKAIFNVETNFKPNIDYEACFARGIHVLTPASVFALPVAEIGLGMALSIARNIHGAHVDFVGGRERYGLDGNAQSILLSGSDVGFVGFGDLGRALHNLLYPFKARIRAYDPWLPKGFLDRQGVESVSLDTVLSQSDIIFIVASVTTENQHLLNKETLARVRDGGIIILLSRAALVDFAALSSEAASGRLKFATDVFPQEPVPEDDLIRRTPGILFSAHRAGALTSALQAIGSHVLEDLSLINRGLPPITCRRAERETVEMLRSKQIELS